MVTDEALRNLAKYEYICAVRLSDKKRIVAKREVIDQQKPVRWSIVEEDHSFFKAPVAATPKLYATSELGREPGYGTWGPMPVGLRDSWPIDAAGNDAKKQMIPEYPLPDTIDYLVD